MNDVQTLEISKCVLSCLEDTCNADESQNVQLVLLTAVVRLVAAVNDYDEACHVSFTKTYLTQKICCGRGSRSHINK